MLISLASLVVAMRLCWNLFGRDPSFRPGFQLMAYLFAPVAGCLATAQIGLLLLLGVLLFMFLEARRPFLAGAALLLPFAKPHLLSLLWLSLALWSIDRKQWRVIGGLAAATALAILTDLCFLPTVFQDYRAHLATAAIGGEFIPSLAGVTRMLFFRSYFWMQFLPLAVGAVWCVCYFLANRLTWDWRCDGLSVTVVSVLTTPYGWLPDEVVLLPAVLQAAAWMAAGKRPGAAGRIPLAVFALLNGLLLLMVCFQVPLRSGLYFWSSAVWALWYAWGWRWRTAPALMK
jgi:hypothetical protein